MLRAVAGSALNLYEFIFIMMIALIHIFLFVVFIPSIDPKGTDTLGPSRHNACNFCDLPSEGNRTSTEEDVVFIPAFQPKLDVDLFLRSLKSTSFMGKTIILTTKELKDDYEHQLSALVKCGIEIATVDNTDNFAFLRAPYDYLSHSRNGYFRIAIADPTRVVFFHDPFLVFNNPNRVYSLKRDLDQYSDSMNKEGSCASDFDRSYKAIYDPVMIAGGQNQLMKILKSFFDSAYTKTCMKDNNLVLAWSQHGNIKPFKDLPVQMVGLVSDSAKVSFDPEKVYDDGFLERYTSVNNNLLTPIVVDYQKSTRFSTAYKKICNVKY